MPDSALSGRSWAWRVFVTCWLVYCVFWTPYLIREHFPAVALVERGSLNVERYAGWTGDIFRSPAGGAFINNNPGASLTGAIPLLLLRPLLIKVDQWSRILPRRQPVHDDGELFWRTLTEGRAAYFLLVEFLTVALVMAPITAGVMALLCVRLVSAGVPGGKASAGSLLCGLATPILFRTAYLNHNLLVADAGFCALLLLWNPYGRRLTPLRAATAGLLAGYAVLCDFSGLVVVIVVGVYVWLRSPEQAVSQRWRLLAAYGAGVLPGIAALMLYQAWAFGSFYRPSQHYMQPTAPTSRGYRGIDWPSLPLMWANFFDPRFGLFAYCPALLLAFAAPLSRRVRYRVPRREMWILLAYFGLFVLFCSANEYSWLQPLTGFRYLVPVVPGLAVLAIQAAQALPRRVRGVIAGLACVQSLVMATAHENSLRSSLTALWSRGGVLLWMIRLHDAGLRTPGWLPVVSWALLMAACLWIWMPAVHVRRAYPEKRGVSRLTAYPRW
jgi:hypothetical protein